MSVTNEPTLDEREIRAVMHRIRAVLESALREKSPIINEHWEYHGLVMMVYWTLKDEVTRKEKTSRRIRVHVLREAFDRYLKSDEEQRSTADSFLLKAFEAALKQFDADPKSLPTELVDPAEWIVSEEILFRRRDA